MGRPPRSLAALFFGSFVLASAGGAAFIYSRSGAVELAVSAAALMLVLALGLAGLVHDRMLERKLSETAVTRGELRRLRLDIEKVGARLEQLEDYRRAPTSPAERPLVAEVDDLRRTLGNIAAEQGRAAKPAKPAKFPTPGITALDHRLDLFLEPIVALAGGQTAHYRASIALAARDGRQVSFEELSRRLDGQALRRSIDLHCLSRVLPLTGKLVVKRRGMSIFVPLAAETFSDRASIDDIRAMLDGDRGFASAVTFEIDHKAMAGLGTVGVEGLAALASQGPAMALTHASPQGIDLKALRDLHFRHLSFPASGLPRTALGKPDWATLAAFAGDLGFSIEVRGVASAEQADRAKTWAKFGSGPAFAPPRRVKCDAGAVVSLGAAA
jgi:cyclic-di-GMP phosphodiesterase TipF (flagellum assembly factor)